MPSPDTQWPRYEVFKQDRPGRPHQNVGSVHAPDAELALQNARDVFARRPSCHSLWVVPVEAIAEQACPDHPESIEGRRRSGGAEEQRGRGDGEIERFETEETTGRSAVVGHRSYAVFAKQSQRQGMTYVDHVGEVAASSAAEALQQAPAIFPKVRAIVWWVCPVEAIVCSQKEDVESMFTPANDKRFRMPNEYRTVVKMHRMKRTEES